LLSLLREVLFPSPLPQPGSPAARLGFFYEIRRKMMKKQTNVYVGIVYE
jgi:hypothetical protein